jgi:hypothetical protein
MTSLSSTFIDYSNEKSSVGFNIDDAITDAHAIDLNAAIAGLSLGTNQAAAVLFRNEVFTGVNTPPSNHFAQRELKFRCKYTDSTTGKQYSFSIPCADAALTVGNTDMVDLADTLPLALKTQFELYAVSEFGNAVTLDSIELIGRSS